MGTGFDYIIQKLFQFSEETTRLHNTVKFRDPMQEPDLQIKVVELPMPKLAS